MLHDLGRCDLKDRRQDLRLALLYKIVTGHVAINPDQIGLVAVDNRTRVNHRYKFRAIGASSTGLRHSFAVRTVRVSDWNHRGRHIKIIGGQLAGGHGRAPGPGVRGAKPPEAERK